MNRRAFVHRLASGAAALVVAPKIVEALEADAYSLVGIDSIEWYDWNDKLVAVTDMRDAMLGRRRTNRRSARSIT